ncbi:MAG: hypothetical protein WCJ37_14875 [Syntrophus sp. (in: bacteria)]
MTLAISVLIAVVVTGGLVVFYNTITKNKKQKKLQEIEQNEAVEIAKIDKYHNDILARILAERRRLAQGESSELKIALENMQNRQLLDELPKHKIEKSCIAGIGEGIIERLNACNIWSAADIHTINFYNQPTTDGRHTNFIAEIRKPGGDVVCVRGIGVEKGLLLQGWKNRIAQQIMVCIPQSLTLDEENCIKRSYIATRQALDEQEAAVQGRVILAKEECLARYRADREALEKQP